jgi:hypothetical protein
VGAAVLLGWAPDAILPTAIVMLVGFAVVSLWSSTSGRAPDCGCYNGILTLSPVSSLALDALWIALLVVGLRDGEASSPEVRPAGPVLVGLVASVVALLSRRYLEKHGRDFLDLSPLRIGREWSTKWFGPELRASVSKGEILVVFLGATCGTCKRAMPFLNAIHRLGTLPFVVGLIDLPGESELNDFKSAAQCTFPLYSVKPWRMSRFVRGRTPTYLLCREGRIVQKWTGKLPQLLVEAFEKELERRRAMRLR